jgi:hypothetical protein
MFRFLATALFITSLTSIAAPARANQLQCLFTQECEAGKSCTQTDMSGQILVGENDQIVFQTELGATNGVILPGGDDNTLQIVTFPVNHSVELISVYSDGSARYTLQGFTDQAFTLTLIGQCGEPG